MYSGQTMRKITPFIAVLFIFLVNALAGCAGLQSACEKAMPVLIQGQSYGTDALSAISQAEAYASQIPLSADVKSQIGDAIDEARRGVNVGVIALAAGAGACSATDPATAFKELIAAWTKIESLLGTNVVSSNLKVTRRPLYVPAIVRSTRPAPQ